MKTPVWLLDVDGVLNVQTDNWGGGLTVAKAKADREYTLRWAPALIDRIRDIAEAGHVEIRWCTTWCPWAENLENLWGLPKLGRAWDDERNGPWSAATKRDAADTVLLSGRPLIWTDDSEADSLSDDRALCIAPYKYDGLTPGHLAMIAEFISAQEPT